MHYTAVIDTPPGRLAVVTAEGSLHAIDFVDHKTRLMLPKDDVARKVVEQLQCYFADARYKFDLPLKMDGTVHQQKVWQQLQRIRTGETLTYGELAKKIHSGARAVGNSCRSNPVTIVVPCHRVVSTQGIGGYGGHVDGKVLERKYWLLRHEGVAC